MHATTSMEICPVAVHIGKTVKARVKARRVRVAELAYAIGVAPKTIHAWYKDATWDTGALLECSKLLKEDLFKFYSDELRGELGSSSTVSEPTEEYLRSPRSVEITIRSSGTSGELMERIIRAVEDPAGAPESPRVSHSTTTRKPRRSR